MSQDLGSLCQWCERSPRKHAVRATLSQHQAETRAFPAALFVRGLNDATRPSHFPRLALIQLVMNCRILSLLLAISTPLVAQTEIVRLTTNTTVPTESFGETLALDGDVMLSSAPSDPGASGVGGSVYVLRRTGGVWAEEQVLTASPPAVGDRFGQTLALDGNVAVVGAPGSLFGRIGTVHIFRYNGSRWVEEQVLGGQGTSRGSSVALEGKRLVLGVPGAYVRGGPSGNHAGAAEVFEYNGTTWNLTHTLVANDPDAFDGLGSAVAISGNTILCGAPGEGDNHLGILYMGAVYAFDFDGVRWNQVQKMRAISGSDNSQFGLEVQLQGDVAAIGAPWKDYNAGAVYVFRRKAGVWRQEEKMRSPWLGSHQDFGLTIALDGQYLVTTDHGRDTAGNFGGAAYAYRYDGARWLPEPAFQGSQTVPPGVFGYDVVVQGSTAVVGAWEDLRPHSVGAVYVFDVTPSFHLMAHPLPLESGEDVKFNVRNAPANDFALLLLGLTGPANVPILPLGITIDIAAPIVVDLQNTGAGGDLSWEYRLPANAAGLKTWFQVVRLGGKTNVIASKIR